MNWPMHVLGEVADVLRGVTFSKADAYLEPSADRVAVLRAGNISERLELREDLAFVDKRFVSNVQRLRRNDIVMCMSSGSANVLGKSALLEEDWTGSFGAFLATIRVNSASVCPRYLAHFLKTPAFRTWASASSGIGIKNVRASDLKVYPIPLPPLEEQKRIAAILDQADALRRLRRRALDRLNTLRQAIFHEMFGQFETDFGHWPTIKLSNVVADAKIGLVRGSSEMGVELPVPYLRMDSIGLDGTLRIDGLKHVMADEKECYAFSLRRGDLLFNTRNSRELVGKTAVVRAAFTGVYNNNILRCRFSHNFNASFFDSYLRTPLGRGALNAIKSGTTSVFAIYQKSLLDLDVPIPPIDIQQTYSDRLEQLYGQMERVTSSESTFSNLFTSLQHRAFRGEL